MIFQRKRTVTVTWHFVADGKVSSVERWHFPAKLFGRELGRFTVCVEESGLSSPGPFSLCE